MTRQVAAVAAFLAVMAAGCGDPTQQPPSVPPGALPTGAVIGGAAISGRATFAGSAPAPEPINMGSDATCHTKQEGEPLREDLLVGADGSVKNVFVHVVSGLEGRVFAPPAEPVSLDQRGCLYKPHVAGIQVGQPLLIINSDSTLHNVHAVTTVNKGFNFGMSVEGQKITRYFHRPEIMVKAKCDVHPWMAMYLGVVEHPFFSVTGQDGRFSIAGLPAGTYVLEAWHEKLGTTRQTVTLGDGEKKEISFTFPG
ncbi:MAG TPA: carboxypeptidase regulatory-like domain-containing protein [Candidatus Polarisedimenticolia bacterium]|nr:carboxypeptidase regulatory-like domain-containing protein [Candidatus Polarisedimenticolia bacterium]